MDTKYKVEYWCDITGDHRAKPSMLENVDSREFNELSEAIDFINECTDPITQLGDLDDSLKMLDKTKAEV